MAEEESSQQVSNEEALSEYRLAERRVGLIYQLASDLSSDNPSRERKFYEKFCTNPIRVNAIGYKAEKRNRVSRDPSSLGCIIEELVYFTKLNKEGKEETLELGGWDVAFNRELYNIKVKTDWEEGPDKSTYFVPIVDQRGHLKDIVALTEENSSSQRQH